MKFATLAIIGAGNMGASLVQGLLRDGYPSEKITVADPDETKLKYFVAKNIRVSTHNENAIKNAEIVLFAIKPQMMHSVLQSLKEMLQKQKTLIISIAAGIRTENISQIISSNPSIVRVMPNTPAIIGCSASVLFANKHVTQNEKNLAESILRAVGLTVWIQNENLMDAVTALSGSGPAYFFLVMEILQKAGEKLGLSSELSRILTLQTAFGAAKMALESDKNVNALRSEVTSKGGTTEAAMQVLEKENIRNIFEKALNAACTRSHELAPMLEK